MLQNLREKMKSTQRGAIMVFFAILVPLFLGAIGLAVDAGFLYMQKAKLQDVADATALAGAGHLNDGDDRDGHVASAVIAFAGANGYEANATSSNFLPLGDKALDSSVTLGENAEWRIAYAIDENMNDKDGEQRDHVRVVMLKRVPTFFIRLLFPEQKEVVVKAVAAAEYVEGEEVVSYGGAKVYCAHMDPSAIYDDKTIVVDQGKDFSLYLGASDSFSSKIPFGSVGTIYNSKWDEQLPNGWNLVRTSKDSWNLNDPIEKAEKEALDKARSEYEYKINTIVDVTNDMQSKISDYKNNIGNKRYIGPDANGEIINTIKSTDNEIELFMDGTDVFDYGYMNKQNCLVYNDEIKNVKKITKLLMTKNGAIDTNGVEYGDIYVIGGDMNISGTNNNFKGILYANGANMYVGGQNNTYSLDTASLITSSNTTLKIGRYKPIVWYDSSYYNPNLGQQVPVKMCRFDYNEKVELNSSWKMVWYSGSGSSSSGSSGSGAAKAHVRLVI